MEFKPLHNLVMIRKEVQATGLQTLGSGLLVFEATAEADAPCQGTVVAVGPGKYNRFGIFVPTVVKPGDVVIFGKASEVSGTQVKVNNEKLLVIPDENVIGVLHMADSDPVVTAQLIEE